MRDTLIHLLAGVDGNEASEPAILDHLYGRQADALIAAGWRAPVKHWGCNGERLPGAAWCACGSTVSPPEPPPVFGKWVDGQ